MGPSIALLRDEWMNKQPDIFVWHPKNPCRKDSRLWDAPRRIRDCHCPLPATLPRWRCSLSLGWATWSAPQPALELRPFSASLNDKLKWKFPAVGCWLSLPQRELRLLGAPVLVLAASRSHPVSLRGWQKPSTVTSQSKCHLAGADTDSLFLRCCFKYVVGRQKSTAKASLTWRCAVIIPTPEVVPQDYLIYSFNIKYVPLSIPL